MTGNGHYDGFADASYAGNRASGPARELFNREIQCLGLASGDLSNGVAGQAAAQLCAERLDLGELGHIPKIS